MMCVMPKRSQAPAYQLVVKFCGSQVLNHGLPSESTTTLTRMPIRKMKKAAVPAQTNHVVGEATSERSPGDRAPAFFLLLSLIHISEPTRLGMISYAVFCLKKKK